MTAASEPRDLLTRLMDGYLSTQMLYAAARLGLADALVDGPRTSAELAPAVGVAPDPLHRLMRGLVMEGVMSEQVDGRFALTEAGRLLCADNDSVGQGDGAGPIRGAVLARGALYYHAAAGLLDSMRDGGSAFRHVYGVELFEHLSTSPEHAATLQQSMLARSHREAAAVAATYDFSPFNHVIDIGGGYGVTLAAILKAHPGHGLRGTLFDRPDVAAHARTRLADSGLAERVTVVGGDFFESVPGGGDVYVLSRVLHDWDDENAVRILMSCRRAMPDRSRLLIVEAILGERVVDQPAAVRMDLHMLTLLTGRERTVAELETLLSAAGLRIARILTPSETPGIQIVEATFL